MNQIPSFKLLIMIVFVLLLSSCINQTAVTIHFDAAGGASIESIDAFLNESPIQLPETEREGYDFIGWSLSKDSTDVFNGDISEYVGDELILYAIWIVTVIYEGENVIHFEVISQSVDTLEVEIVFDGDVHFVGYDISVQYDTNTLSLSSYTNGLSNTVNDTTPGLVKFNYVDALNQIVETSTVITLEFDILGTTPSTITIEVLEIIDINDDYTFSTPSYDVINLTINEE